VNVILSGVAASRSEVPTQSKDPVEVGIWCDEARRSSRGREYAERTSRCVIGAIQAMGSFDSAQDDKV
jgi:hypothetical protein